MTRTVRLICALVSVFLVAAASHAQERVTVSGTVTDPSGAVVPGALVEAIAGGGIAADGITGQDGRYRLEVPAGLYELRARLQGFAAEVAAVNATTSVMRDLRLAIAAIGDTLVVTAARTATTRASAASSVSVFSAADLAALGSTSIAEALRFAPGLAVESNGREGAQAALFSRGGESDYNLVLIDGVRLNNPGGAYDFSRISVAAIERVEVVRGGQSALYGSDAMGSVVQIFTRRAGPSDPPGLSGSIEGGSFNTWRGDVRVTGGARQRLDYSAGVLHRRTDGAFADELPEGDRFDQTALDGGFGAVLGNRATLRTGARFSDARGRAVGPIAYGPGDTGTASDSREFSWHLDLTHRIAPRATGTATATYSRNDSEFGDLVADRPFNVFAILAGRPGALFPEGPRLVRLVDEAAFTLFQTGRRSLGPGEFLATTPFGVSDFPFTSVTKFRRPALKYQANVAWLAGQTLTGGYEFERESDPLNSGFRIENHAYFAQQQFTAGNTWFMTVGGRIDDNSHYGTQASPKLSAGAFLIPFTRRTVSSLKLFTNIGQGIKNPVFAELFGSTFTDGNPDLEPERARTIDGGVELTFMAQRLRTTVTYFDNRYRDQVAFRSTGFGRDGRPDFLNIAGSKANGWELEGVLQRALAGVTAAATYALIDTEVTATTSTSEQFQPGQPLLRRPRHSGSFRIRYEKARAAIHVDARMVGRRHDAAFLGLAAAPSVEFPAGRAVDITVNPGYAVVGIGGDYRIRDELAVFARMDNLANETYETALGFPGLPRSAVIGIRMAVGIR